MAIALGSNLVAVSGMRARARFFNFLSANWGGFKKHNFPIRQKAGVPVANTAADDPGVAPSIILDTTNSIAYLCDTRTNSTTFTIIKLAQ